MANININNKLTLTETDINQVKGGPAYIKIGDIKGEATDSNHESWINLDSVSYRR